MINKSMDALVWLRKQLETDDNDLLREMVRSFAEELMAAEADVICGAPYGEISVDRVNRRNGYRSRRWDTRTGSIDLKIPKLRTGSYFPDWLLDARTRSERAFIQVVTEAYVRGVSTRRVEGLVETLGITSLSKSQVSEMATSLDEMVDDFRDRPLDAGPYTYVWADALTMKVREGGRIVNIACLLAVGVNAEGNREILGVDLATAEDGAGWLAFFRSLVARGLTGVQLVISDDHTGLVDAIAATLPGASWQRCRTHYLRNLLTKVPKTSQSMVATMVRTIFAQPDPKSVWAQHRRIVDHLHRGRPHRRRRASRPGSSRDPGVHRVPQSPLAPDLVQQPPRTAQQGDPAPHQRRRHLPHPAIDRPPRRSPARRTTRRMGHRPAIHEPRIARPNQHPTHRTRPTRGGDPSTRTSNRLEKELRGRRGATHTPRPRT